MERDTPIVLTIESRSRHRLPVRLVPMYAFEVQLIPKGRGCRPDDALATPGRSQRPAKVPIPASQHEPRGKMSGGEIRRCAGLNGSSSALPERWRIFLFASLRACRPGRLSARVSTAEARLPPIVPTIAIARPPAGMRSCTEAGGSRGAGWGSVFLTPHHPHR